MPCTPLKIIANMAKTIPLAVLLMSGTAVHLAHSGEINRVEGVIPPDVLNVRTGPGARFADIGDISPGATVDVIGYSGNRKWAIIMWRNQRAYISAKFLQPLGVDASGNALGSWKPRGRYSVGNLDAGDPGLNLRAGDSARSGIIDTLPAGTLVRVVRPGKRSGWVFVVTQTGKRGYVKDTFLNRAPRTASGNSSNSGQANQTGQRPNCPLPGVFTVVNVASNDRLNIRNAASVSGGIVGTIGPSEAVAVIEWGTNGWAKVSSNQQVGYVKGSFLQCGGHTTNQAGFPTNLTCYGAEPFWSANINNNGTLDYRGPDGPVSPPATFQSTNPNTQTGSYPYTFAAVPFSGTLNRAICTDGMSDNINIWGIQLNIPNSSGGFKTVNGCCRMK